MDEAFCANGGVVVGRLFSPECVHCQRMEGAWTELKNLDAIKKAIAGGKLTFVDIDVLKSTKDDDIADVNNKCGVELNANNGVPTIFLIKNKRVTYYEGDRTAEKMAKWVADGMGGSLKGGFSQAGGTRRGGRSRRSRRPFTRKQWMRKHTTLRRRPRNIRVFGVKIW